MGGPSVGSVYFFLKKYDEVCAYVEKALEMEGEERFIADAYIIYTYALNKLKKTKKALSKINDIIKKFPKNIDLLVLKASFLSDLDRKKEALHYIESVIIEFPDESRAYHTKCEILISQGKTEDALSYINKTIEQFSNEAHGYEIKADILIDQEKTKEALQFVNEIIDRFPDETRAYELKSNILIGLDRRDEAFKYIEENIERFPDASRAYELQCEILIDQDTLEDALDLVNKVIKEFPHTLHARELKCEILTKQYKKEEVLEYVDLVINEFSDNLRAHELKCEILVDQDEEEKALIHINKTIRRFSGAWRAYELKGKILLKQGKTEESEQCFTTSFSLQRSGKDERFRKYILENYLATKKAMNPWLDKSKSIYNIFSLNYRSFNLHERVLFAYGTLENALRFFLYYYLHYKLQCDSELVKQELLEFTLNIRKFPKTFAIFSYKDKKCNGRLEQLWDKQCPVKTKKLHLPNIPRQQRDITQYNLNYAIEIRNAIAHARSMSLANTRDDWRTISGVTDNECYEALYVYLKFYIDLQKIFKEEVQLTKGVDFIIFKPNHRGLGKRRTLSQLQTELIMQNIKPQSKK